MDTELTNPHSADTWSSYPTASALHSMPRPIRICSNTSLVSNFTTRVIHTFVAFCHSSLLIALGSTITSLIASHTQHANFLLMWRSPAWHPLGSLIKFTRISSFFATQIVESSRLINGPPQQPAFNLSSMVPLAHDSYHAANGLMPTRTIVSALPSKSWCWTLVVSARKLWKRYIMHTAITCGNPTSWSRTKCSSFGNQCGAAYLMCISGLCLPSYATSSLSLSTPIPLAGI